MKERKNEKEAAQAFMKQARQENKSKERYRAPVH
jgi:hypothetical protein